MNKGFQRCGKYIKWCLVTLLVYLPLFSFAQDKDRLAQADSLHRLGLQKASEEQYEDALHLFERAADFRGEILGKEHSDYAKCLNNIGTCYLALGEYDKAVDYYRQTLAIRENTIGRNHLDYASCLDNLGDCYFEKEDFSTASEYYLQALGIWEKNLGKNDPDYAISLNNLGVCHDNLGDYEKALDYYLQAISIQEKILKDDDPDYAESLYNTGTCYRNLGEYEKAIEYLKHAVSIQEKVLEDDDPDYAESLYNIGTCYSNLGEYEKAIEYLKHAVSIQEKVLEDDNPDYAASLFHIGSCYRKLGNYTEALSYFQQTLAICEKDMTCLDVIDRIGQSYYNLREYNHAIEYFQQALAIIEKTAGKELPDYAFFLSRIGRCCIRLGDYTSGRGYFQQALAIIEKTHGVNHPEYAKNLNGIGRCFNGLGDFSSALGCFQRALSIQEMVLGKDHPDYAESLEIIGNCYLDLGDYSKAMTYFQQGLAIFEKNFGKNDSSYAAELSNIGVCYVGIGDYGKALDLYQSALPNIEKVYGNDHPQYALILNNIGICYDEMGDYGKSLECYQSAMTIFEKVYGKKYSNYAILLNNIATCYNHIDDNEKALEFHQQAKIIGENTLGKSHPQIAKSLYGIALCYGALGDYAHASVSFGEYNEVASSIVIRSFSCLTESQREYFWNKYNHFYTDGLYRYASILDTPEMNRTAYDGALLGKGLLLNAETEMRKLIGESGDAESLKLFNEIQESRILLDSLYQRQDGKKAEIDSLDNAIETRQQELIKRCKVFGDYTKNLASKWTDVQSALGKNDIAIEFETFTRSETTFYVALTLKRGYTEPHLVPLFNSAELEDVSPSHYYVSSNLPELVWGPLSEELEGVQNIYFSPAGELNNIGIEYLLDKDGEHLISDKRNCYRLTSTRELVKEQKGNKISDATVYGGILYDVTPKSRLTGEETGSERLALSATRSYTHLDSLSGIRRGWEYLPGTKAEAEAISSTLKSRKIPNDLIEGENGTEESFKALSGTKKDVIHIATHGFYWTEREVSRNGMETSSFMLDMESQAPKEDKALTRSGLLFAGAQNAFDGKEIPIDVEDGILTAKDVSRMDLRGTDLVVISACQSGLGEVTGDGVFGLQRGFKKAGVQSIVMSLWEVNDEATRIMMTRFYENLAKGKGKYESFREAQKYLRKYDGGYYDKPEYYAAFVLLDAIK